MEPIYLLNFVEVVFSIFAVAFWLLFLCAFAWSFIDVLRRRDLSGWGKAGWTLLLFAVPMIGVLIYVAARPAYVDEDNVIPWAPTADSGMTPAEEVEYAQGLLAQGKITQDQFEEIKLKVLY